MRKILRNQRLYRNNDINGCNKDSFLSFLNFTVKSQEASEDVVADSFIKLWERRETLESSSFIRAYLYTTVRKGALTCCAGKKERLFTSLPQERFI